MKIFITGIDTDIGKTVASAILAQALKADYFKPIQCGDLNNSDSKKVQTWTDAKIFPENYKLKTPKSPHLAASIENTEISLDKIQLPKTNNKLIIEGAGGLLVPLNNKDYIIDIPKKFNLPVILVCKNYLGSLNHTLLSIEALKKRNIKIMGLIFNGTSDLESEKFLEKKSGVSKILNIEIENKIDKETILKYSQRLDKWI